MPCAEPDPRTPSSGSTFTLVRESFPAPPTAGHSRALSLFAIQTELSQGDVWGELPLLDFCLGVNARDTHVGKQL